MSLKNKNFKIYFSLIFCGLLVGATLSYFSQENSRQPASNQFQKSSQPQIWAHSPYQKMNQVIQVSLVPIDGIPENDNQELRLQATVILNRPVDQELSYKWILPEGVTLVSGELEDAWPGIQAGEFVKSEISVLGMSLEGLAKTVTLHVYGKYQSIHYANSGSFTTHPRSFEDPNEELALIKKQEAEKIEGKE